MESSTVWDILPNQLSRPSIQNPSIEEDHFWSEYEQLGVGSKIHIAILSRTYLELILAGDKTVESRFSVHRRTPYKKVDKGDIILFKQTGGLIQGIGYVESVEYLELLNYNSLDMIRKEYYKELQIQDESYWDRYSRSMYGSLIRLNHVRRIDPMKFSKRDRNAWVVFEPETNLRLR